MHTVILIINSDNPLLNPYNYYVQGSIPTWPMNQGGAGAYGPYTGTPISQIPYTNNPHLSYNVPPPNAGTTDGSSTVPNPQTIPTNPTIPPPPNTNSNGTTQNSTVPNPNSTIGGRLTITAPPNDGSTQTGPSLNTNQPPLTLLSNYVLQPTMHCNNSKKCNNFVELITRSINFLQL